MNSRLTFKNTVRHLLPMTLAALLVTGCSSSQNALNILPPDPDISLFGQTYQPVGGVDSSQVQIVFFRENSLNPEMPPAHLYVDRQFHAALLPNGYVRFCVRPGAHTLEAYMNDAPGYEGKGTPRAQANLKGGNTYFMKVTEAGGGTPTPLRRVDAERELIGMYEQVHAISRSASVEPCIVDSDESAIVAAENSFLFAFNGRDFSGMLPESQDALNRLVQRISSGDSSTIRATVTGYSDSIGNNASAQQISNHRARSVANILIDSGLPAGNVTLIGQGSASPVVDCPASMPWDERVACNQPNRRVEVQLSQ